MLKAVQDYVPRNLSDYTDLMTRANDQYTFSKNQTSRRIEKYIEVASQRDRPAFWVFLQESESNGLLLNGASGGLLQRYDEAWMPRRSKSATPGRAGGN
jgi:hypothetical protein